MSYLAAAAAGALVVVLAWGIPFTLTIADEIGPYWWREMRRRRRARRRARRSR